MGAWARVLKRALPALGRPRWRWRAVAGCSEIRSLLRLARGSPDCLTRPAGCLVAIAGRACRCGPLGSGRDARGGLLASGAWRSAGLGSWGLACRGQIPRDDASCLPRGACAMGRPL